MTRGFVLTDDLGAPAREEHELQSLTKALVYWCSQVPVPFWGATMKGCSLLSSQDLALHGVSLLGLSPS